ncbi:hypothetical protein K7X08_035725 [Anisodus acutangulus]|uniref:Uncharacterized protein n=1 Tax=Anisodus acutangulus TaxID=402998 RepID=A0A9Q1RHJ3_9SOLA|nr:hypothetical protein K7X08_035725 [Anisodus acutangulus]
MEECNKGQADQHQQSRGLLGDKCEVVISNYLMVQESERHDVVVDKKDLETRLIEVRGDVSSLYSGSKEDCLILIMIMEESEGHDSVVDKKDSETWLIEVRCDVSSLYSGSKEDYLILIMLMEESEGHDVVVDKNYSETRLIEVRGDVSSLYSGSKEDGLILIMLMECKIVDSESVEGTKECNKGQADQHQESRGQLGDKCEVVISNDLMVQESKGHDVVVDKKDSETRLIEAMGDDSSLYSGS